MRVIGIDPRQEYRIEGVDMHQPNSLSELLPQADFIITTVPHTPETEFTFNKDTFALMKSTCIL